MRVAQIIDTLNVGGAEQVLVDVSNILYENNVNVEVLVLIKPGVKAKSLNPNIPIKSLGRTNKFSLKKMLELKEILLTYDILHCHFRHVYRYVKLIDLFFNLNSKKIILHDHYGSIDINKSVPLGFNSLFKIEYYIGVSDSLMQWAYKSISPKFSLLLANIIRKSNNSILLDKVFDFIVISNIKQIKNQIFAASIAKSLDKSILFIGDIQDLDYYNKLIDYCESSNIDFQILTKVSDAQSYLKNAVVALQVSKSETGPLVLIEYLAHGMPFLSFNTGEVVKLISKEHSLFVVDSFHLKDWVDGYNKLINLNLKKSTIKKIFSKNFSEQYYFKELFDFYKKILS
jgi:glycosyltransferase involved in cell wall biosynthesis